MKVFLGMIKQTSSTRYLSWYLSMNRTAPSHVLLQGVKQLACHLCLCLKKILIADNAFQERERDSFLDQAEKFDILLIFGHIYSDF